LVPLKSVSNVSRFKPALNLNRVLADLNRGSNSLNSISVNILNFGSKRQSKNSINDLQLNYLNLYLFTLKRLGGLIQCKA